MGKYFLTMSIGVNRGGEKHGDRDVFIIILSLRAWNVPVSGPPSPIPIFLANLLHNKSN